MDPRFFLKNRTRLTALLLFLALILTQSGCGQNSGGGSASASGGSDLQFSDAHYAEEKSFYFDTVCQIRIYAIDRTDGPDTEPGETSGADRAAGFTSADEFDAAAKALIHEAFLRCADYEALLSKTIPDSDVGRINAAHGAPVQCAPETIELLRKALDYAALSDGAFDVTIGAVQELWDFHAEETGNEPALPDEDALRSALPTVGYRGVFIDEAAGTVQLADPDAKIDLGGIAKGWIADRLCDFLRERGAASALVSLGGNVAVVGSKPSGEPFRIGVEKPFSDRAEILGLVDLTDGTLVTSGTYERSFEIDGVRYHHILDPATGYPAVTDVVSVTVLSGAGKSGDCDALATICLLLGSEKGLDLIGSLDGYEALFVLEDGGQVSTSGFSLDPA